MFLFLIFIAYGKNYDILKNIKVEDVDCKRNWSNAHIYTHIYKYI